MENTLIDLKSIEWALTEDNSIIISERDVPFATSYDVKSSRTGEVRTFEFAHSTGPEFEPDTKWVYESEDGIVLEVANDPKMTKAAGEAYLRAKTRNAYGG